MASGPRVRAICRSGFNLVSRPLQRDTNGIPQMNAVYSRASYDGPGTFLSFDNLTTMLANPEAARPLGIENWTVIIDHVSRKIAFCQLDIISEVPSLLKCVRLSEQQDPLGGISLRMVPSIFVENGFDRTGNGMKFSMPRVITSTNDISRIMRYMASFPRLQTQNGVLENHNHSSNGLESFSSTSTNLIPTGVVPLPAFNGVPSFVPLQKNLNEPLVKRGRGRPPKSKANGTTIDAATPKKTANGRFLVDPVLDDSPEAKSSSHEESEESDLGATTVKRGRGRPPKTAPSNANIPNGHQSIIVTLKRGRGRPPRNATSLLPEGSSSEPKKKPGRPPKTASWSIIPSSGSTTAKRGRGRPPKKIGSSESSGCETKPVKRRAGRAHVSYVEKESSESDVEPVKSTVSVDTARVEKGKRGRRPMSDIDRMLKEFFVKNLLDPEKNPTVISWADANETAFEIIDQDELLSDWKDFANLSDDTNLQALFSMIDRCSKQLLNAMYQEN